MRAHPRRNTARVHAGPGRAALASLLLSLALSLVLVLPARGANETTLAAPATSLATTRAPTPAVPWFGPPRNDSDGDGDSTAYTSAPVSPRPAPSLYDESDEERAADIEEEMSQALVIFALLSGVFAALLFVFLAKHRAAEQRRAREARQLLARPSGLRTELY